MPHGGFSSKLHTKTFLRFVSSSWIAGLIGFRSLTGLERRAARLFESPHEGFWPAQVPALRRVLPTGPAQPAPPALLRQTRVPQTQQSRKSAPLAPTAREPNLLPRPGK